MKLRSFILPTQFLAIAALLLGCDTKIRSFTPGTTIQYVPAAVTGTSDAAYFVGYNDDGYKKLFKTKGGFTAQITDINPGADDPFTVALDNIRFYQGTLVIYTLINNGDAKNAIYGYDGTQPKATLLDEFTSYSFNSSNKTDPWNVSNYYYVKNNQVIQLDRKTLQKTVLFSAPNNAAIRSAYYGDVMFLKLDNGQYGYLAYKDAGQLHWLAITPAGTVTQMGATAINTDPNATGGLLYYSLDYSSKLTILFNTNGGTTTTLYGISGTTLYTASFSAEINTNFNPNAGYSTGYTSFTYNKANGSISGGVFTDHGFSNTFNGNYTWGISFPSDTTPPFKVYASSPSTSDCYQLDLTTLLFGACI